MVYTNGDLSQPLRALGRVRGETSQNWGKVGPVSVPDPIRAMAH